MYSSDDGIIFGFQSLTSLFGQTTTRGRYSRPRDRETESESVLKVDRQSEPQSTHDDVTKSPPKPFFAYFPPEAEQSDSPEPSCAGSALVDDDNATSIIQNVAKQSASNFPSRGRLTRMHNTRVTRRTVLNEHQRDEFASLAPVSSTTRDESLCQLPRVQVSRTESDGSVISKVISGPEHGDARQSPPSSIRRRLMNRRGTHRRAPERKTLYRKEYGEPRLWGQTPKTGAQEERTPNPFERSTDSGSTRRFNAVEDAGHAWGLSPEDQRTIDTLTDPYTPSSWAPPALPPSNIRKTSQAELTSRPPLSATTKTNKLTHLNPSGEAHMVNVGAKLPTKRTAIATASIFLTDSATLPLITSNQSKKGDVLGVARIAGIMAAKRTSSLIPLCHPIAITKVDLDVTAIAPKTETVHAPRNDHGVILCQARVDCFGPTGVEMEALTAVSVAALTVYDMLKAVDKSMSVRATRLAYKAGGRSGVFAWRQWYENGGEQYLRQQGLELPKELNW